MARGWFEASVAIFLCFLGRNKRRKVRSNSATEAATNPGASLTNPRFHTILLDLGTERKIQVIGSIVHVYYMYITCILHSRDIYIYVNNNNFNVVLYYIYIYICIYIYIYCDFMRIHIDLQSDDIYPPNLSSKQS